MKEDITQRIEEELKGFKDLVIARLKKRNGLPIHAKAATLATAIMSCSALMITFFG